MVKHILVTIDDDSVQGLIQFVTGVIKIEEELRYFVGKEDGDVEVFAVVYPCWVTDPETDNDICLEDDDDLQEWANRCGFSDWQITEGSLI